ncbi:hypothetical protein F2Q70_00017167 [Brassica cretica]|uniref:Uncharacterized protein n=1 Tax=Brassica cretica TaxID=69181 RepID=A0A8S9I1G7_BRACR|nr:hypothetical protein F2Q70_00017167 [Brassica cretica]KAF2597937.1 hypothetical protein F2Q68_00010115 [Brassica cretica]
MSEEDEKRGVNAHPYTAEMTEQDTVMLMTSNWESLSIPSTNVTIKMSYQYPTLMQIDDGDGSTPQFISDDHEVEAFVKMRFMDDLEETGDFGVFWSLLSAELHRRIRCLAMGGDLTTSGQSASRKEAVEEMKENRSMVKP